jgi:hypothetical protein
MRAPHAARARSGPPQHRTAARAAPVDTVAGRPAGAVLDGGHRPGPHSRGPQPRGPGGTRSAPGPRLASGTERQASLGGPWSTAGRVALPPRHGGCPRGSTRCCPDDRRGVRLWSCSAGWRDGRVARRGSQLPADVPVARGRPSRPCAHGGGPSPRHIAPCSPTRPPGEGRVLAYFGGCARLQSHLIKDAIPKEAVMKKVTHRDVLELIASINENELYDKLVTRLRERGELTDTDLERIHLLRERERQNKPK